MARIKNYPSTCVTDAEHTEFLYRAQELLRLAHNAMGEKVRGGLITQAEWNAFLDRWDQRSKAVIDEILKYRQKHKNSTTHQIDIEGLFIEEL